MNVEQAYNKWSESYDAVVNRTRDLEARAIRGLLVPDGNSDVLEIGCGTGKNTEFLKDFGTLTAVDFSDRMLAAAKTKIDAPNVRFERLDLREKWNFADNSFDLATCSLVLEHLADLDHVFAEAARVLRPAGRFYIGELHPFKQYLGGKARFETGGGVFEPECFVHNFSEFFDAAAKNGFEVAQVGEWFDEGTAVPRLLTLIFRKRS